MSVDQSLISYISTAETDKIIATFTDTIVIPAGGEASNYHELPTAAGHVFWAGTYTLDGGTQQNDIGGLEYSGLAGAGVEARSYVGGIRIRGQNGTGSDTTASYTVACIASPETGVIPTVGEFAERVNTLAFDSRETHPEIEASLDGFDTSSDYVSIVNTAGANQKNSRAFFVWTDDYMYEASAPYGVNNVFIFDDYSDESKNNTQVYLYNASYGGFNGAKTIYVRYYYA